MLRVVLVWPVALAGMVMLVRHLASARCVPSKRAGHVLRRRTGRTGGQVKIPIPALAMRFGLIGGVLAHPHSRQVVPVELGELEQ